MFKQKIDRVIPELRQSDNKNAENILFVNKRLDGLNEIIQSANPNTQYIVYESMNTYDQINNALSQFESIKRIAFMFALNESHPDEQYFADHTPYLSDNFVTSLCKIITDKKVTNVDFLACNTLVHNSWKNMYVRLTSQTGVIVGASNDTTGNIKYGGDWVMENTSQNVQNIYFTSDIKYYNYVLDTVTDIQIFKITYTHDVETVNFYVLLTIDINNWTGNGFFFNPDYFPEIPSPENPYNQFFHSWFIDCEIYINDTLTYTKNDILEFTLYSPTEYPFGDPENLNSILEPGLIEMGFAVWTSDNNIFDNTWWNRLSVATLGITDDSMYISNIQFVGFGSNTCFPAKTLINTNIGDVPIEKINPRFHTIRNKPIIGITKTVYASDKYLVCFEKDSLGDNIPSKKTTVSKNHQIFYKGKMMPANEFLHMDNIKKVKYNGETLYNVLMEKHDKMMVNNLICETLDPISDIAKFYIMSQNMDIKQQLNLIQKYNNEYKRRNMIAIK